MARPDHARAHAAPHATRNAASARQPAHQPARRGAPALLSAAVGLAALLGAAAPAAAQDAPPADPPAATPSAGMSIQIDISETVDGKASQYMTASYFIRKKLRDAGFRAWTTEKLPPDAREHAKAVEAAKARGEEAPKALEDLKPTPSLIITGKCDVRFDRESTFYGAALASVYVASATYEIKDASGKVLAEIGPIADEWGKDNKTKARNETLQRIGLFSAVEVLASEPIQARLTERGKASVQEFIDKINKQRKQDG